MSARARERGDRVEWRIVCNASTEPRHKPHAHMMSARTARTAETRSELLDARNTDPVMHDYYKGCLPMRIECRYVSDWTTDIDRIEGLAQ